MPLVGLRLAYGQTTSRAVAVLTGRGMGSLRTALWLAVAAVVSAACAGQQTLPPQAGNEEPPGFFPTQPITDAGAATQNLYGLTFVIAVVVFVIVEGLLLYITFRYRRRAADTELPNQTHGSNPLEILWTVIPAITVTVLFVAAIITLTEEHETRAASPSVIVDVTGFQWQWTFDYPNEGLSFTGSGVEGPVMAMPINEVVRVRLHAQDVIHSFYVPQFLYKKDAVPGRVNEFDVIVREAGTYAGQCAEFCGLAHAEMFFTVDAMERSAYDAWVTEQQNQGGEPGESLPPDSATVTLTSVDINTFDPETLQVAADQPIVFDFRNADPAVPHNVAIVGGNEDGTDWVGLPPAQGGQNAQYVAPPLAAATYEFYCALHPATMRGTLNVGTQ